MTCTSKMGGSVPSSGELPGLSPEEYTFIIQGKLNKGVTEYK